MIGHGARIAVAFRPAGATPPERPLQEGLAWVVVTVAGERISELRGFASRAQALEWARGASPDAGAGGTGPPVAGRPGGDQA